MSYRWNDAAAEATIAELEKKLAEAHDLLREAQRANRELQSRLPFGHENTPLGELIAWLDEETRKKGARVQISCDAWHPVSVGTHIRYLPEDQLAGWLDAVGPDLYVAIATLRTSVQKQKSKEQGT